ncbi:MULTISPECIES: DUF5326 family protein [Streptomyces]|uniref:DUF5326 family protein n=1 Tax=Streptomyces TaxID=1883 RepID=UPI00163C0151|nr:MULTISPECIES: DUF5326 family protein [Streptomyces]MBC2873754.1 DUF5326 family protein [Streptomyces sp. TYQ1024]UBI37821.1 DUF5326 family protein [Streptomyces mobaraensis]UKW30408.1 DUF5326 family protein [Streptomyces sp. TYQ1024]
MGQKGILAGLPWWVKWIALPVLVCVVFGSLIISVLGIVIDVLFKALLLVALIGGLVFVVKKFTGSSSSKGGDW